MSAPSVYQNLRELRGDFSVYIFEYDRRFAIYGEEFVFYDYNNPLDLPEKIAPHSFDIVVADPPYLSEECLRKTSETIKFLTRGKILLCTGRCQVACLMKTDDYGYSSLRFQELEEILKLKSRIHHLLCDPKGLLTLSVPQFPYL